MADFRMTGDPTSIGCSGAILGDHVENIATGDVYIKTGTGATAFTLATAAYGGGGVVAGALSIEEADGSPSYANITTVRFDQADGFVVTNPTAGVARVDITGIPQANVSGLVADLAAKASSVHTHAEADVTGLLAALAGKVNLAGTAGGQTLNGGNAASENLTLSSTSHATKGKVILGTASAYDQANDRLGIGTTSPSTSDLVVSKSVAGATGVSARITNADSSGSSYVSISSAGALSAQMQIFGFGSAYSGTAGSNIGIADSALFRANSPGGITISSQANGSNSIIRFCTNGTPLSSTLRLAIDNDGNVVIGNAALATNATNGFFYIDTCAGTPTGVPTSYTGRVAMVYDTTNDRLYAYNGGWKLMQAA